MSIAAVKIDRIDRKILEELQADARLSSADLAERVSLTASPCWRPYSAAQSRTDPPHKTRSAHAVDRSAVPAAIWQRPRRAADPPRSGHAAPADGPAARRRPVLAVPRRRRQGLAGHLAHAVHA